MNRSILPTPEEEKRRYEEHNNDVNDPKYQAFVSPITSGIFQEMTAEHSGLDFGSGTGPVVSKVLKDRGYNIREYDPFFASDPHSLKIRYDYIVCCEVIEHFHHPAVEFKQLHNLLNPGGPLYCMTHLYHPGIDFNKWYYKNDPTHVFIYQKETLQWIKKTFRFTSLEIHNRMVVFTK